MNPSGVVTVPSSLRRLCCTSPTRFSGANCSAKKRPASSRIPYTVSGSACSYPGIVPRRGEVGDVLEHEPHVDERGGELAHDRDRYPCVTPVPDLPEDEAVGRARPGRPPPGHGLEDAPHVARCGLAQPDVDERADDRAHHLVTEGVGPDLEAQEHPLPPSSVPAVDLDPPGASHPPHERRLRLALVDLRPPAERREVVLAEQRVAGRLHRPQRQRLRHEPRPPRQQRVGRRGVPDVVAVLRQRAENRASKSSAAHSAWRTAIGGAHSLLSRRARSPRSVSAGRSPDTTWPQAWTPASVRPAPVSSTGWRTTVAIAADKSPTTVRTRDSAANPWNGAPS